MAWRDPWDTVDRANALRGQQEMQAIQVLSAMQGAQTNALQQQSLRQQMADEQAVRTAYQTAGGDMEKLRAALTQGGQYKQLQALEKADLDKRKALADIGKDEADTALKKATMFRDTVAGINDQAGWDAFRSSPEMKGRNLPEQFTPQLKNGLVMRADDYIKRSTPEFKAVGGAMVDTNSFTNPGIGGYQITPTIGEKETARHNQVQEGISRGQLGVAQGNLGVSRERLAMEQNAPRGQFDSERGLLVDPRTGQARPVTVDGQPVGPKDKDLTDSQSKALLFGTRMQQADSILGQLAQKGTTVSIPGATAGNVVGPAINAVSSPNQQSLVQAKRDFINAVLRRESGAVISPSEFDNAEKQYFPQVGDSPQVIAQKSANRRTAINGIMQEVPERKRPKHEGAVNPAGANPEIEALLKKYGG